MSDQIKAKISSGWDNSKNIDIYGLPDQAIGHNGKFVRIKPSQVDELVGQIQGAWRVINSESENPTKSDPTV